MKGSNVEHIVDGIRLQYNLYELENIPEEYCLGNEDETRVNNNIEMLNFIILPYSNKFRIADN